MKKLIINADDLGYSKENNEAIKEGYLSGIITSASLLTNMEGFEDAINRIIGACPNLDIGFHFNIMEGKSLTHPSLLCNEEGIFNRSYLYLIANATNKKLLAQTEGEFRAQIEKALSLKKITHIDSHVHTHAIPQFFKLITKLAREYNVEYIRTQKEIPYFVLNKSINTKYPVNIIKNMLLNTYTHINQASAIKTNDYFIGILYTGMMDEKTIIRGLNKIKKDNSITEVIFHPTINRNKTDNYKEYEITQDSTFKSRLKAEGFELTTYLQCIQ